MCWPLQVSSFWEPSAVTTEVPGSFAMTKASSCLCLFTRKGLSLSHSRVSRFHGIWAPSLPSCQSPCTNAFTLRVLSPRPENKQHPPASPPYPTNKQTDIGLLSFCLSHFREPLSWKYLKLSDIPPSPFLWHRARPGRAPSYVGATAPLR